MLFFHTDGNGLFLLFLCLIGPAIAASLTGSFGGAAYLKGRSRAEQDRDGLAIARHAEAPQIAPKEGPVAATDQTPAPRHAAVTR